MYKYEKFYNLLKLFSKFYYWSYFVRYIAYFKYGSILLEKKQIAEGENQISCNLIKKWTDTTIAHRQQILNYPFLIFQILCQPKYFHRNLTIDANKEISIKFTRNRTRFSNWVRWGGPPCKFLQTLKYRVQIFEFFLTRSE